MPTEKAVAVAAPPGTSLPRVGDGTPPREGAHDPVYDGAMAAGRDAARHAGILYRKALPWLRHPVREVEAEAEHLLEIEREGKSAETPVIAILGVILFLLPIVLLILGLAFAAYFLAG
jgi:hypothetical protein